MIVKNVLFLLGCPNGDVNFRTDIPFFFLEPSFRLAKGWVLLLSLIMRPNKPMRRRCGTPEVGCHEVGILAKLVQNGHGYRSAHYQFWIILNHSYWIQTSIHRPFMMSCHESCDTQGICKSLNIFARPSGSSFDKLDKPFTAWGELMDLNPGQW